MSRSATASHTYAFLYLLTPVVLAASLLLGGATHGEALSSGLARAAAIPLFAIALWRLGETGLRPGLAWPLAVLVLTVLIPIAQLIPLPPSVWTELPGRAPVAEGFRTAGLPAPWLPISLSPSGAWDALLSLLPPAAMFLAVINLDERARRGLTLIVIGVALAATVFGVAQVASGQDSALRLYSVTNVDSAVGFFANRNHHAALLFISLPLTAYWLAFSEARSRGARAVYMIIAAGLLVIFLVSLGVTRSRAGVALGAVAVLASAVLLWFSSATPRVVPVLLVALLLVGGGLVASFALEPLLQRFQDPTAEARLTLLPNLIAAAKTYFPIGSGLGSFVPVYQLYEQPATMTAQYINHAHDDYLELLIETGVFGVTVLGLFLLWFAWASLKSAFAPSGRDADLQRVAAIVVLLLLAHSALDYPMRTVAISVVFALACALLTPPPNAAAGGGASRASAPANDGVRTPPSRRLPIRPSVTTRSRRG